MNPQHLDSAAELCKLVGKADLLDYLGLAADVGASEAQARLKDRRRYMQGMQSNPKYREEALFLIKNFTALNGALSDPPRYLGEVARSQESSHVPIVEMTINSVLRGGSLTRDQADYLERNARQLGVSSDRFHEMLGRLAAAANVSLPGPDSSAATPLRRPRIARPHGAPGTFEHEGDLYQLLSVDPRSTRDQIYQSYKGRFDEARGIPDRVRAEHHMDRLDRAWKILSDAGSRKAYDLSRSSTGPPARTRDDPDEAGPSAPTAPPVRARTDAPGASSDGVAGRINADVLARGMLGAPRLEIVGPSVRAVRLAGAPVAQQVLVRNAGTGRMPGRITTDEPWLGATPNRLDPSRKEQVVTVRVRPDLPGRSGSGVLRIQTDHGQQAEIVFEVTSDRSFGVLIAIGVGALLLVLLGLAAAGLAIGLMSSEASQPGTLTITVDPTAEQVLLDGRSLGSGASVFVERPPSGAATLTVIQPNFAPYTSEIVVEPGRSQLVPVVLSMDRVLDFEPRPGMTQGTLEPAFVERVMVPRRRAMDQCVARITKGEGASTGSVRIHVSPGGMPIGLVLEGAGTNDPTVRRCLERQAAAALFHPFQDGDYATVRYDYQVTEATSQ